MRAVWAEHNIVSKAAWRNKNPLRTITENVSCWKQACHQPKIIANINNFSYFICYGQLALLPRLQLDIKTCIVHRSPSTSSNSVPLCPMRYTDTEISSLTQQIKRDPMFGDIIPILLLLGNKESLFILIDFYFIKWLISHLLKPFPLFIEHQNKFTLLDEQ